MRLHYVSAFTLCEHSIDDLLTSYAKHCNDGNEGLSIKDRTLAQPAPRECPQRTKSKSLYGLDLEKRVLSTRVLYTSLTLVKKMRIIYILS